MKKWLKILFVIYIFALISLLTFLILKAFNITNLNQLKTLLTKSKFSVLIYILIQVALLVFLCFIPLLNTSLVIVGIAIFGSTTTFISTLIAIFFSSTILFLVGDKLGEKFAKKLIGEKELNETQNKINHKSQFWLPVFFVIPGIPDEALCLIAGMTKMKYWYLILVSLIYHAIEIGVFCFIGSGIINWSALSLFDWIILSNLIIIDFFLLYKFEKYLDSKTQK